MVALTLLGISFIFYYLKDDVQPWLGNNGSYLGRNLNQITSYINKIVGGQAVGLAEGHEQGRVAQLVTL